MTYEDIVGEDEFEYVQQIPNLLSTFVSYYQGDCLKKKILTANIAATLQILDGLTWFKKSNICEVSDAVFNHLFCFIRDVYYTSYYYKLRDDQKIEIKNAINQCLRYIKKMFWDRGEIAITTAALMPIYQLHRKINTASEKNDSAGVANNTSTGVEFYENLCHVKLRLDARTVQHHQQGVYSLVLNDFKLFGAIGQRCEVGQSTINPFDSSGKNVVMQIQKMVKSDRGFAQRFRDGFMYCCLVYLHRYRNQHKLPDNVYRQFENFITTEEKLGYRKDMVSQLEGCDQEMIETLQDTVYAVDALNVTLKIDEAGFEVTCIELHQYKSHIQFLNNRVESDFWKQNNARLENYVANKNDVLEKLDHVAPIVWACGAQKIKYIIAVPAYQNFSVNQLHYVFCRDLLGTIMAKMDVEIQFKSLFYICGFQINDASITTERTTLIPLPWLIDRTITGWADLAATETLFAIPGPATVPTHGQRLSKSDSTGMADVVEFPIAGLAESYYQSSVCIGWCTNDNGFNILKKYLTEYETGLLAEREKLLGIPFGRLIRAVAALCLRDHTEKICPDNFETDEQYREYLDGVLVQAVSWQ